MGERWIVGVDGSFGSRSSLAWALLHSSTRDAEITVVHAHHQGAAARVLSAVHAGRELDPGATGSALHELDASIADIVGDRAIERRVISGPPGRALLNAASDATLVIVGRHGAGGSWQQALGSVSRHCVIHSSVPTVVVPTDWVQRPTKEIVVGFDGSENSAAALRWAVDFADSDAVVRALVAIEIAPWLQSDVVQEHLGEELRVEETRLRGLLDQADPSGLIEREVVVRGARPALARAAETADLVVLGARGTGRFTSKLLGSVSTWMLDASAQPIIVVPTPERHT